MQIFIVLLFFTVHIYALVYLLNDAVEMSMKKDGVFAKVHYERGSEVQYSRNPVENYLMLTRTFRWMLYLKFGWRIIDFSTRNVTGELF